METASKPLRLFFAVPVTEDVRARASRCVQELSAAGADAAWLAPQTLHLTLRFLGATPPGRLPALERALEAAVQGRAPFALELDRLGFFGPERAPKVIWAGVGAGLEPLTSLAEGLAAALEREGVPREERPFSAHLTLGRLRSSRNGAKLRERLRTVEARWGLRVDRVVLYSSTLSPHGAVHTPLRERELPG